LGRRCWSWCNLSLFHGAYNGSNSDFPREDAASRRRLGWSYYGRCGSINNPIQYHFETIPPVGPEFTSTYALICAFEHGSSISSPKQVGPATKHRSFRLARSISRSSGWSYSNVATRSSGRRFAEVDGQNCPGKWSDVIRLCLTTNLVSNIDIIIQRFISSSRLVPTRQLLTRASGV
jgi:hypothetical protein